MLSIAGWLFPERGPCANPCRWYRGYRPCAQYSDCVPILLQICVQGPCSRFLSGYYLLVGLYAILLHRPAFKYSFGRSLLRKGRSLIGVGPAKEIKYSKNLGCSSLLYAECLFLYIFYLMNVPKSSYPRIVIIGGGFAGISLAKKLSKKEVQVVLIDKHNYHTFQPLLYQVSTGGLEPDSIAYPIRKILQDFPNFIFRLANVEEIR